MPTINFPTHDLKYFSQTNVFIRGDQDSIDQYIIEHDEIDTMSNIILEDQRFSNNGALTYQYWNATESIWVTEFGFDKVIVSFDYTESAV